MAAEAEAEAPDVPALPEASSPEVEAVAALGTPLSPESADVSLDGNGADAPITAEAEAASDVGGNGHVGGNRRGGPARGGCRSAGATPQPIRSPPC